MTKNSIPEHLLNKYSGYVERNRQLDAHHIMFTRVTHEAYDIGARLRQTPELIPTIYRPVHNAIHDQCPAVPTLGYFSLLGVRKHFEPVRGDVLATVDNLCFAIDEAAQHPRQHEIDRSVCDLAVSAIRLQLPFLRDSLVPDIQQAA